MWFHKFFKANQTDLHQIRFRFLFTSHSKLVKLLQTQVWPLNFTNFSNVIFGGFLHFVPNVFRCTAAVRQIVFHQMISSHITYVGHCQRKASQVLFPYEQYKSGHLPTTLRTGDKVWAATYPWRFHPRTTDARWGNRLHYTAENQIQIPIL